MIKGNKRRLGNMLVAAGLVTDEQLEEALRMQREQVQALGAMLTGIGLVTRAELARALAEQAREHLPLGQILVREGLLTEAQLDRLIVKQHASRAMLGSLLVSLGYLEEEALDTLIRRCLALESGTPAVHSVASWRIEQVPTRSLGANCFVVTHLPTGACVVVDAGESPELLARVASGALRPAAVWLTHGHADHVDGLAALIAAAGCPVWVHPADEAFLPELADVRPLADGERLAVGGATATAMHVPGHTPGGMAFVLPGDDGLPAACFSGDVLMPRAVGRSDLKEGSPPALVKSLRRLLNELPDAAAVFPGHGDATSLAAIKQENKFCAFLLRPAVD